MSKIVVGNLKMSLTKHQVEDYVSIINKEKFENVDLILCPSFIHILMFNSKNYSVGAQNVFYEQLGPYTGEISAMQLKEIGVNYVIIGHSERRTIFNETNSIINKKINACLDNNIKVILCIGENKEQKDSNETSNVLKKQIEEALYGINSSNLQNIIIAYEPVYSIGTGNALTKEEIKSNILYIKSIINSNFNSDCKIIYGGSVNKENVNDIIDVCDGIMVGKMSNDAKEFIKLLDIVNK